MKRLLGAVQDLTAAAGIATFCRGVWLIYKPAGYLFIGAFLFAFAWFWNLAVGQRGRRG